jgi:hypothetical protein
LLRRGLVQRRPAFEIVDRGLLRLAARMHPRDPVEASEASWGWKKIQRWLFAAAGLAGALLVLLAPDLLNSSVAVLTALTGGLPVLVKLFGLLGEEKDAASRS